MGRWDYSAVSFCPGCAQPMGTYHHLAEVHECRHCGGAWQIDTVDWPPIASPARPSPARPPETTCVPAPAPSDEEGRS